MMKKTLLILLLGLMASAQGLRAVEADQRVVVAYVTSWSSIKVDPTVMTHINYAFGHVSESFKGVGIANEARFREVAALKQKNPDLKVLLSIGGWGSGRFSEMADNETYRTSFAKDCKRVIDQYGIDGIDIDWEYPTSNAAGISSSPRDKANFTLLMRDIREAIGSDKLLTLATCADGSTNFYAFRDFISYVDFVNVMSYDMAGTGNHHAALYRGGIVGNGWKVGDEAIKDHLNNGVPKEKLVMGLAFYGNSGAGSQISLQEIKNMIASGNYVDHWDDVAKVPYITEKATGKWSYGYDNERSQTIKCNYILDNGLRGAMYWEYANDDNDGTERNTVSKIILGKEPQTKDIKFDGESMAYVSYEVYASNLRLEQGKSYAIEGDDALKAADFYFDRDFFARQDDGTLKFLAVDGQYRIVVDLDSHTLLVSVLDGEDNPARFNTTDGTGALWIIGSSGSIGKPHHGSGWDWSEANAICMAPIAPSVHQITLTVGQELAVDQVNFKFFLANNWSSGEYNTNGTYRLTTTSDIFVIGDGSRSGFDNGNIYLRSGQTLKTGDTYIFSIDCTTPAAAVLSVTKQTETTINNLTANFQTPSAYYTLTGLKVAQPTRRGIYIRDGKKVVVK